MDFRFLPTVEITGKEPEASFDGLRVKVGAVFGDNEKALPTDIRRIPKTRSVYYL